MHSVLHSVKTVSWNVKDCQIPVLRKWLWHQSTHGITHLQHNQACLHILVTVCGPGTVVSPTASVSTVTDGHTSLSLGQPATQRNMPVECVQEAWCYWITLLFCFYLPVPCLWFSSMAVVHSQILPTCRKATTGHHGDPFPAAV